MIVYVCAAWRGVCFMHAWAAGLLQGESVQPADGMSGQGRGHFGGEKKQQNKTI